MCVGLTCCSEERGRTIRDIDLENFSNSYHLCDPRKFRGHIVRWQGVCESLDRAIEKNAPLSPERRERILGERRTETLRRAEAVIRGEISLLGGYGVQDLGESWIGAVRPVDESGPGNCIDAGTDGGRICRISQ